jgi:hypothetical protein
MRISSDPPACLGGHGDGHGDESRGFGVSSSGYPCLRLALAHELAAGQRGKPEAGGEGNCDEGGQQPPGRRSAYETAAELNAKSSH